MRKICTQACYDPMEQLHKARFYIIVFVNCKVKKKGFAYNGQKKRQKNQIIHVDHKLALTKTKTEFQLDIFACLPEKREAMGKKAHFQGIEFSWQTPVCDRYVDINHKLNNQQ